MQQQQQQQAHTNKRRRKRKSCLSCFCCYSSGSIAANVEGLQLKTVDCDWMSSENASAHHTTEYSAKYLILRRAQTFTMKMKFQRKFHKTADRVVLELNLGTSSQLMNETKVRCPLVATIDPAKWGMVITHEEEETFLVTFTVNIPPKALVGKYKSVVEFTSQLESGESVTTRDNEPEFAILFNPWSKLDSVYIENEAEREEYCLNDLGIVYRGSKYRISGKKWNFGQFEENILECSLLLLDKDKRAKEKPNKWIQKRGDPVWISRAVSAMVNAQDDDGVLVGNWSGDYSGGVSPTKWNGSVEILQQYYNTGKPVSYGQCWVFSGLVTTVLRSLGIPTRSVTNFASAHDTEGSMTIDNYVDESGEEIDLGGDSVWNFHVWNECWMKRGDLPTGYDGWQAVDATPQEISLGLYQTGPAPLTAIKNGEVYLGFETAFVFAEVNSDRANWIVKQDEVGEYVIETLGSRFPKSVGKYISTKSVGSDDRLDVTNLYKYTEDSAEEREAFKKAYAFGTLPEYQAGFLSVEEEGKGVSIDFSTAPNIRNGDGFAIVITAQNDSAEKVTVDISAVLHSTLYTGEKRRFIKRQRFSAVPVDTNSTVSRDFNVMFSDYNGKLVDLNSLRLSAVVKVKETGKMFADSYEFRLDNKEAIDIQIENTLQINKEYQVLVNFSNPLPTRLTNVVVTLEGPGLSEPLTRKLNRNVVAGGTAQFSFPIKPKKVGKKSILVDVDAKQVKDLKNFFDVEVVSS
ncbi:protein-glutamine gamma-glutamyltransferase K isoform X1 [Ciona intestinalis]